MLQRHTRSFSKRDPGGGERHGAPRPLEERRADDFLQRLNLPGQGRLCDTQSGSRLPEMEFLGQRGKISKLAESCIGGLCHRSGTFKSDYCTLRMPRMPEACPFMQKSYQSDGAEHWTWVVGRLYHRCDHRLWELTKLS
jgi:hypothetical protein